VRFVFALLGVALAMPAWAEPDLSGTWILTRGGKRHPPAMTEAGAAFRESYDFKKDDPSLLCIPASWSRVFANPNTPFELTQTEESVRIRHELFDVDRTVRLGDELDHEIGDTKYPSLGESVAWYDGDDLLIHTNNYGDKTRVLSTGRSWEGLPQSPLMVTLERYRMEGKYLVLDITHFDPLMYTEPLLSTYRFWPETEWEVEHYGCDPATATIVTPE
jgi:hypothetical protein